MIKKQMNYVSNALYYLRILTQYELMREEGNCVFTSGRINNTKPYQTNMA